MHVLHVAPTAFGRQGLFGGGERYPLELARATAGLEGVTCELVTFASPYGMLAGTGAGGAVRDVGAHADGRLRVRVLTPVAHWRHHPAHPLVPALPGALDGADIVHTHHLHSAPSRLAALTRRLQRRPVVVTDHGLAGSDWFGLLPRLFDRLLAVSHYSASVLGFGPARTRVIYGGADPVRFAPDPDPAAPRRGVLFVGRLTPHKGVDRLLSALPRDAALTVAGTPGHDRDPPERDYPALLRRRAAGRDVRFLTGVDDDALAALYRRAAVVAVPSVDVTCYGRSIAVSELLGLSTIEAMASATPVVASRLGGLTELVVDGETGFLVAPGDGKELHDRLAELLAHPGRARRMGNNARSLVLERYTWGHCAQRCVGAYRDLAASATSDRSDDGRGVPAIGHR